MSDSPRLRRNDPARDAPVRDLSNIFRAPGAASTAAPVSPSPLAGTAPTGVPDASAAPSAAFNEEARSGIDTAYQVIDQYLREGRLAAQAQAPHGTPGAGPFAATPPSAMSISSDSIQEVITQGLRFYSSLTPLWAAFLKSLAAATVVPAASTGGLAPAPLPPTVADSLAPVIVEIASARMVRVTVDVPAHGGAANLAIGGLLAPVPGQAPLTDVALVFDPAANRHVLRIRVPDSQPPGFYSGVVVDRASATPRGTITLRIDG
jgi:hypothetical protein